MPGGTTDAEADRALQCLISLDLCQWGPNRKQAAHSNLDHLVRAYFQKNSSKAVSEV